MTQPTPPDSEREPFEWTQGIGWHKPAHRAVMASVKLGAWLSAALDDPNSCAEFKADITEWFSAGEPMEELGQSLTTLRQRADKLEAAWAGYRAAVAFISADAWDGCSDCINVLKAARCADFEFEMSNDEIAENLARIRKHYDPAKAALGELT